MKLNYKNLFTIYSDVSTRRETDSTIKVQSMSDPTLWWLFSPERLCLHRKRIASLLMQLLDDMMQSKTEEGLPWFMAFCRKDGTRWGDMDDADKLLAMARASSMVKIHHPLTVCDVPFCVILDQEVKSKLKKENI